MGEAGHPGGVVAFEIGNARRLEHQQAMGHLIEEIAIVADAEDRAGEILER